MKAKVVLSLSLFIIIGLFLSIDMLYDSAVAEQVQPSKSIQATTPIKSNKAQQIGSLPTLTTGFDWSLPTNTIAENYSGLIGESSSNLPYVKLEFIAVRWDKTNPKKDVYNFSGFDQQLKQLSDKKVLIRLEVNSSCEAPVWALKKLRSSKDKSLIFWDSNYISLLKPYLKEFAKRYASSPQIAGVHLGIGDGEYSGSCKDNDNKDGWGEFWMSPEVLAEAQINFGLTPEIFERQSKKIIDAYANAFGKYQNKLAYTNQGPLFSWEDIGDLYNQRLSKIANHALDKGVGSRDGAVEQWLRYTNKIYGSSVTSMPDGTCRLDYNEGYAKKVRGRYWGTENEFYGDLGYVLGSYGPYENQPYRFLVSSLRSLQMRRNFMSINSDSMKVMDHPVYKTQEFMGYLTKALGKQMENTPDAFVLLGERYMTAFRMEDHNSEACVKNSGDKVAIRSFGRWLTETSVSSPAIKTEMPAAEKYWGQEYYMPYGLDYEYFARESKQFSFNLNDELSGKRCKQACEVEIKVTFKDTIKTGLNILLEEGQTQKFQTAGDSQIKTVSFKVKSRLKNGILGTDFVLQSSKEVIPVILLRVNFL